MTATARRRVGPATMATGGSLIAAVLLLAGWLLWPTERAPAAVDAVATATLPAALPVLATPIEPGARRTPIPVTAYQAVLQWRSPDWQVARLAENPAILVIEFPDLLTQGQALNRLAALIEKNQAPRDRVLGDDALARFIQQNGGTAETFYFGHDYPAEAIARFFTLAVSQQLKLNASELRLGNLLLAAGLLIEEKDRMVASPKPQAVVSFSGLQADNPATKVKETVDARRRQAILRHELSHGEFFTNEAYRSHSWAFWKQLAGPERERFVRFLTELGYDPRNEELMVNEMQAFLMHTPDRRAFDATSIGLDAAALRKLRRRFAQDMPASIFSTIDSVDAAAAAAAALSAPR